MALYSVPARTSRYARALDSVFFAAIVVASAWSLLRCRSPGIVGTICVGLNACMCTVFAVNFLLLRDPRRIKRADPATSDAQRKGQQNADCTNTTAQKWHAIPDGSWLRLSWVLDLIACLRALKWSWNPQGVSSNLASNFAQDHSRFYRRHIMRFVRGYFGLDVLKCTTTADPHFYGFIDCPAPPALQFLPTSLLHVYRLLLAATGVACTLHCFGSVWALLQVGIMRPGLLGLNGEPCMFPPLFGSPAAVLRHGLKGFWSHVWHQIFRAHFSSIGDKVASSFFSYSSFLHSATRLFTVFFISGILHACASYTLLGPSDPLSSRICFAAQPVGTLLQDGLSKVVHYSAPGLLQQASLCCLANASYYVVWLMFTCAPLADDFSRDGTWMLEPVPISFTRGLGMSRQDDRWLPWIGSP